MSMYACNVRDELRRLGFDPSDWPHRTKTLAWPVSVESKCGAVPRYPNYGASDSCPGWPFLLPNMPAFAGHTTGRADFPHSALGQDFTPSFACDAIGSF